MRSSGNFPSVIDPSAKMNVLGDKMAQEANSLVLNSTLRLGINISWALEKLHASPMQLE
jgi:hypothetical protein